MKRTTLLNAPLSGVIAAMGHGDLLVIGDAGLPVPRGVPVIDLAVTKAVPGIFDVLDAVLAELVVERAALAEEAAPELVARFAERRIGAPACRTRASRRACPRPAPWCARASARPMPISASGRALRSEDGTRSAPSRSSAISTSRSGTWRRNFSALAQFWP